MLQRKKASVGPRRKAAFCKWRTCWPVRPQSFRRPISVGRTTGESCTADDLVQRLHLEYFPQASVGYPSQSVPSYAPTPSRSGNSAVIGEGTAAYQHALREAQIIAARGSNYHRHGDGGHPLGVAPGCSYAGTGYTWDPNRPGHCYLGELPDSRIVARARAQGANGAWFWSAHYR